MSTRSASAAGPAGAPAPSVIARRSSPGATELRQFLTLNGVAHRWIDPDSDPLMPLLGGAAALAERRLPLVVFADGSELEPPEQYRDFHAGMDVPGARPYLETAAWRAELAQRLGLPTRPAREEYDVLIVGAGPAGLTAAVYAASEGLTTLVLERTAPGGQAGTSARIENYPGFPQGISGAELAAAIHEQAIRFGAEILIGVEISQVKPGRPFVCELPNGSVFRTHTAVVAPGVQYRRLDAPGIERLVGSGVHYGSAPAEARTYRGGQVAIVGAANSAGQAAVDLAQHAARVTLLVRGGSLRKNMSHYLAERIEATANITVRLNSRVASAEGDARLERLVIADTETGDETRLPTDALFILIGAAPLTNASEGWLRRDEHGFLMTGPDLLDDERSGWPLRRDPLLLESNQPGVFVAGDVRHGSIKRVANAVGEGSMAITLIHQHLRLSDDERRSTDASALRTQVFLSAEERDEDR
jgi:thioredoxin reductase (NADPH)